MKWGIMGNGRVHYLLATPRRVTLFFNTLPLAANRLIARQLTRKAENLFKHEECELTRRAVFNQKRLKTLA